jgi:hypothetical protein
MLLRPQFASARVKLPSVRKPWCVRSVLSCSPCWCLPVRSALSRGARPLHGWCKLSASICTRHRGARTRATATSVACSSHRRRGSALPDERNRRLSILAIPRFRSRSRRASSFTALGLSGCATLAVGAPGARSVSFARRRTRRNLRRRCTAVRAHLSAPRCVYPAMYSSCLRTQSGSAALSSRPFGVRSSSP